jgi:hypothetical protein
MTYPEGYLWENPGFPSLTVSYLKTNDFFFSGHVGLPIIMGSEFLKQDKKFMFWLCIFVCCFESFTMIVTRGHYIIDIIAGVIIAHYSFMIVDLYIHVIDDSFVGIDKLRDNNHSNNEHILDQILEENKALNDKNKEKINIDNEKNNL